MLILLASIVVGQARPKYVPVAPPGTSAEDRRYGCGNPNRATVVVDGNKLPGRAIIRDNRVQAPMRPIFQALGANVTWYPGDRRVEAMMRGKTVTFVLSDNFAYNPERVLLEYPPRMVRGAVYVPLRFVAQAFGAKIRFDQKRKTVCIDSPMREGGTR